jgi:hypothetical protein
MLWPLLFLAIILLAVWVLRSNPLRSRTQGFQESCQLQVTGTLPPEQVKALLLNATEQINSEIAQYTESVKVGPVTVKGIGNARLSNLTIGSESQILPCTSTCVCQKSEHFPQGAALRLVGATASVIAPDIEISFLGGLGRMTATVEATVRGIDAVVETDCQQGLVITAVDLQEVEITKPEPSSVLGKLLAQVPQQREQLLKGLRNYVLNKTFQLPQTLASTPLLCQPVKV